MTENERDEHGDNQQITPYVLLVIEKTARTVIEEHERRCPVNKLKDEVWGNGKKGLKSRMERVEQSLQTANGVFGWLAKNWQLAAVLILVTANFVGGGKRITPEEIKDISQQIKQLQKTGTP